MGGAETTSVTHMCSASGAGTWNTCRQGSQKRTHVQTTSAPCGWLTRGTSTCRSLPTLRMVCADKGGAVSTTQQRSEAVLFSCKLPSPIGGLAGVLTPLLRLPQCGGRAGGAFGGGGKKKKKKKKK